MSVIPFLDIADGLPSRFFSTYVMVRRTYSDGIPSEEYKPLLAVLLPEFSNRSLARFLGFLLGAEYFDALNDVYEVWADGLSPDDEKIKDKVIQKLKPFGYDEWLAENDY